MHKAGSSIADKIIVDFCEEKGYQLDRISKKVFDSPLRESDVYIQYQKDMVLEDVYYGMARGFYIENMEILPDLKAIVQVRDPRDCLTSAYYSFRESHVIPNDPTKRKLMEDQRKEVNQLSIDEYVTQNVNNYRRRMKVLRGLVETHTDVLLLTYEEMVCDTERWLQRVARFIDQPVTSHLRERIGDKIDFSVPVENSARHKRQVLPGDHRRKLDSKTIDEISHSMREELEYFGYR